MSNAKRKNLGRGLSALLGDTAKEYADLDRGRAETALAVTELHPCKFQPRRLFDDKQIEELAQSIKEQGVLQPLVVRRDPADGSRYEIVCGERRWRAAQRAQVHELPVVIKDLSDEETVQIALVENLQRENLSPLEEADAYQRLITEFGHTQERMAQSIGKSRSHVANTVRLLQLPSGVKKMLEDGRLSAGHGRALLAAADPDALAKAVIQRGLNVRDTEALVRRSAGDRKPTKRGPQKDADTLALERDLTDKLGLRCLVAPKAQGGVLSLHYRNLDQLDDIIERLTET